MTIDDLRQRIAQPWFDPLGFFVAMRDGELLGFHWTKVHRLNPTTPPSERCMPSASLRRHRASGSARRSPRPDCSTSGRMASRGLLYVDADNAAAIAVYEKLGFARSALDVMYATGQADTSTH